MWKVWSRSAPPTASTFPTAAARSGDRRLLPNDYFVAVQVYRRDELMQVNFEIGIDGAFNVAFEEVAQPDLGNHQRRAR